MNRNAKMKDRRLIEALDYIDDEYIASAALYKMRAYAESARTPAQTAGQSIRKYWKQLAALAACLILLAFASPVFNKVAEIITSFAAGWGSGLTEETSDMNTLLETDQVIDKKDYIIPENHIENAPYFIFSNDLEPISAEKIDEVKNAWYQKIFSYFYNVQYNALIQSPIYANDKENLENTSSRLAKDQADEYKDMLFGDASIDHFRCRYYATLNGYVAFAFNTYLENEYNSISVGNVTISNPTSFYIFVYGEGEIVLLEEAYMNKWLSASDISVICERHNAFNDAWIEEKATYSYLMFAPELELISDEKIKEIRNAIYEEQFTKTYQRDLDTYRSDFYSYSEREAKELAAKTANNSGIYYSELFFNADEEVLQYHYRYYGTINDCVVLLTYGGGESFPVTLDIAGYSFSFPMYYEFEVFVNGGFVTVSQAHESGLLSESDVQKLYERHLQFEECYKNYKQKINESIIGGMD